MEFTEYKTKENDRWDLIAFDAYGDVNRMVDIMDANPDVKAVDVLPSGFTLRIPILEPAVLDSVLQPPWKR